MKPNPKIQQLIKSMGIIPEDEHYEVAEAIVRECCTLLMQPEFIGRSDLDWAMVLNEHFGVNERSSNEQKQAKVVYAQADDWSGLFINGVLVMEDHTLKPRDVQAALKARNAQGYEVEYKDVHLDWMYSVGSFPANIKDVVWEGEPWEESDE